MRGKEIHLLMGSNSLANVASFSCTKPLQCGIKRVDKGAFVMNLMEKFSPKAAKTAIIATIMAALPFAFAKAQSNDNNLYASNSNNPTEVLKDGQKKEIVPLQVLSLTHATHEQRLQWFKDNGDKYPVMVEVRGANSDDFINFVGSEMRGLQFTGLSGLVLVVSNDTPYVDQNNQSIMLYKRGAVFNFFKNPDMDYITQTLLRDEIIVLYDAAHGTKTLYDLDPALAK